MHLSRPRKEMWMRTTCWRWLVWTDQAWLTTSSLEAVTLESACQWRHINHVIHIRPALRQSANGGLGWAGWNTPPPVLGQSPSTFLATWIAPPWKLKPNHEWERRYHNTRKTYVQYSNFTFCFIFWGTSPTGPLETWEELSLFGNVSRLCNISMTINFKFKYHCVYYNLL